MKKLAFTMSILGILLLLILSNLQELNITQISEITQNEIKEVIKVKGEITEIKKFENNFTILKIKDSSGEIEVICECNSLNKENIIEVEGKIEKYENRLQIQADKIKIVI